MTELRQFSVGAPVDCGVITRSWFTAFQQLGILSLSCTPGTRLASFPLSGCHGSDKHETALYVLLHFLGESERMLCK